MDKGQNIEEETQPEATTAREYFFPTHGKVVSATSKEEAEAKLAVLLKVSAKN